MEATAITPTTGGELHAMTADQIDVRTQAIERLAEAQKKLVLAAVKRTYPHDWIDMGGKPYLEGNGALRLAQVGINLTAPEISVDWAEGEAFVDCLVGAEWPAMGQVQTGFGSCSTKDKFFVGKTESRSVYNQFLEQADGNEALAKRMLLPHVKKKAHMNAISRAVRAVMGLTGVTWDDLATLGMTRDGAGATVDYSKGGSRKQAKPAAKTVTLAELDSLPKGSKVGLTADIFGEPQQRTKHYLYGVTDGTIQRQVKVWTDGERPEWAVAGQGVYFPEVTVGEYQGKVQYSAQEVQVVE